MINIAHPVVHTKPPIKRSLPSMLGAGDGKFVEKNSSAMSACKSVQGNCQTVRDEHGTARDEFANSVDPNTEKSAESDCNKNILTDGSGSFELLCNMINDLEQDIMHGIPRANNLGAYPQHSGCNMFDAKYFNQLEPEKDFSKDKCSLIGSTYDDIMTFLESLEDGCPTRIRSDAKSPMTLQEIFPNNHQRSSCLSHSRYDAVNYKVPDTLKEDLATTRLQLEEQNATISLLKTQLKSERVSACEKLESQKKQHAAKLEAQDNKYQSIIKRHQKFIEQVIAEKTDLTEKCNSLAQRIKEMELKLQRDLKTAADRHNVELQRAKEHYAASEKIRRERWLEAKTSKIKEMTVKGLEPELRNMVDQHQQEIQELRSVHIKELQDVELRVIRRTNQQLEQLRLELTSSHEKMLADEKSILFARYKENLADQERQFQLQYRKLSEDFQSEKSALCQEHARQNESKDSILREARTQFQKDMEELKQRHQTEKDALRQSLTSEWESWLENYKRQQVMKAEKSESRIKEECQKERDRQIELAIKRLEKETREATAKVQESYEAKMRLLEAKQEQELQTAANNEKIHRNQLSTMKVTLDKMEVELKETKSRLEEYTISLKHVNEQLEKVTHERNNAKKIARHELEAEKRGLEDKIASLYQELMQNNANKDAIMAQLHSRIKLIMTQKVLTIKKLTQELEETKAKCDHLDKLLDQQRKEYVLKNL